MAARVKRSITAAVITSLATAVAAFAAQPINNATYTWSSGPIISPYVTGLDLTMSGAHKLGIYVSCGQPGSARGGSGADYQWTSKKDATVSPGGSFSYNGKATGERIESKIEHGIFHRTVTRLHGTMTVSGNFTSAQEATGSASVGTCHAAHFTAQLANQEGPTGI